MKIVVALSGGVDSALSAALLQEQGHQVEGLFMKNWEENDPTRPCPAAQDRLDAEQVCAHLGIALHCVNFADEYWEKVFQPTLDGLQQGLTPNPDIWCNQYVKFDVLLKFAKALGADKLATGHYARIEQDPAGYSLHQAADHTKDQSYFLYTLTQDRLAFTEFPLAHLPKTQVRQMASAYGLPNHQKKDSTGICFIGERNFRNFLSEYLPVTPGNIVDLNGNILGQHQGLPYYTLGQRSGLGIGGQNHAAGPWYVIDKDHASNTLKVVSGHDHASLYHLELRCLSLHWINPKQIPSMPFRCSAKIRYRQSSQACTVEATSEGYRVKFDEPQWAISPGQSIVFYQNSHCLGGGIIADRCNPLATDTRPI